MTRCFRGDVLRFRAAVVGETSAGCFVFCFETRSSGGVYRQLPALVMGISQKLYTWTSFSPSATRSTILVRAALSGFESLRNSSSRMAWSSGLSRMSAHCHRVLGGIEKLEKLYIPSSSASLSRKRLIVDVWRQIVRYGILRMYKECEAVV
jgi:hypothetical protein